MWVRCTNYIPSLRIAILSIEPFVGCELQVDNKTTLSFHEPHETPNWRWQLWWRCSRYTWWAPVLLQKTLECNTEGFFVGKDQPIMGSVCLEHVKLCSIFSAQKLSGLQNPWFATQDVFHDCSMSLEEEIIVTSFSASEDRIECF